MAKDNIQDILIKKGRELIWDKGADSLTARKLSDISGYSVGSIYNQFGNMESYILLQNYITLDELLAFIKKAEKSDNPYILINNYLDAFVTYVLNNRNFWSLLFGFHLKNNSKGLSRIYLKKMSEILHIINEPFEALYPHISKKEKIILLNTLWMSVFSLSSFLTANNSGNFNTSAKKTVCKLILNTFLAGALILPEK